MTAENTKIAIYGAGAMGTVLGTLLTLGGLKNVHLITRNEKHVKAVALNPTTLSPGIGLQQEAITYLCLESLPSIT